MFRATFSSPHFITLARTKARLADIDDGLYAIQVHGLYVGKGGSLFLPSHATHFGYVQGGSLRVHRRSMPNANWVLEPGMYFSFPGGTFLECEDTCGFVVTQFGYTGFFQLGGPIEERGRLRYIDGCTVSVLISPPVRGDPCLHHLYFPPHVSQTRHTHPTLRVGMVARGSGRCVIPRSADGSGGDVSVPLPTGTIFVIPTGGHHAFHTDEQAMDIIAWHPDSDTGPSDDDHPVLNRTIVEGQSAATLTHLRTK